MAGMLMSAQLSLSHSGSVQIEICKIPCNLNHYKSSFIFCEFQKKYERSTLRAQTSAQQLISTHIVIYRPTFILSTVIN